MLLTKQHHYSLNPNKHKYEQTVCVFKKHVYTNHFTITIQNITKSH